MIGEVRERRRYSAVIPPSAWQAGREPRQRRRRREAFSDLAEGLKRYLRNPDVPGERGAWTAWATRLASGASTVYAPDRSHWFIRVHIE